MKPLLLYLLLVFLGVCALLFVVISIDPPEPVLLIDATPAAIPVYRGPPVPMTVCVRVLPTQRPPGFIEGV